MHPEGTPPPTQYPFEASNMIVLAKKIVMDKVEPIPNFYDAHLNNIVMYPSVDTGGCSRNSPRRGSLVRKLSGPSTFARWHRISCRTQAGSASWLFPSTSTPPRKMSPRFPPPQGARTPGRPSSPWGTALPSRTGSSLQSQIESSQPKKGWPSRRSKRPKSGSKS